MRSLRISTRPRPHGSALDPESLANIDALSEASYGGGLAASFLNGDFMKLSMFLALSLSLVPGVVLAAHQVERPAASVEASDSYLSLLSEYESAHSTWREELKLAKGLKERRALRDNEPAKIFSSRFEVVADEGDGRALVWLIENVRKIKERSERASAKGGWYDRLFKEHLDSDCFGEVVTLFIKEKRDVSAEDIEATLAAALERAKGDARANVLLGLARYRLAQKCNSGLTFYERLFAEHPDSSIAKDAQREYDRLTKFGMGAVPPDFTGETIDGQEISLSANVGKVTVIDFWGYW